MKPTSNLIAALALLLVSFPASLGAQNTKDEKASPGGLPPLIDRELIFGNPEISGEQLSPDGKYLAFEKPWKDTLNIYVKGANESFRAARLLTTETKRPIPGYLWSRDSKYILYAKDNDGDENYNLYAVDPEAKSAAGADAPAARDLTGLKGIRQQILDVPKKDPDTIYIGLNDRDKAWPDLYRLKLSTGEKTLVRKNTERITGWEFDLQGTLRLATRAAENGDTEVLRVDSDKYTKIYSCNVFESCKPIRFEKDGKRAYMQTNKGPDMDLSALVLLDPETGKTEMVESDPLKKVDFGGAGFSEASDELALTWYMDDPLRLYFRDNGFESDFKWLRGQLPGKEVSHSSSTLDERVWLVSAYSDTEPGETYLFDRKTHKLTLRYKAQEKLPREALAEMKPIHYRSSDGLEIPAYLTLPKGIPDKNRPTIILPHGGPWVRDVWGYNGYAQFFANRGYAVLSMNFRGSTGYGKKFLDAGNKEWGRKMQDDITWGVKYLVDEGIADPKRVGIFGGSYGGYATLAGVTFTPDLYAAAVDLFGPSNLITFIPTRWEGSRQMSYQRIGNPTTPEGKALLVERSPLTSADKIKTPLMIAQGANDPRVNHAESEQIVIALRDRGFPVEYLLIPDEGHGFTRPVNNMASVMATERFFAKYLGGRYQEGGTPEVTARLKEITVDPTTVNAINAHLAVGGFYQQRNLMPEAEQQFKHAIDLDPKNPAPSEALVRLYMVEGKKTEAEAFLKAAKSDFAGNPEGYRMLGDFYFANGDLDKATAEYSSLYGDHPKDIQLKKNYIQLLILKDRLDEATKLNNEVLKSNPNDVDALVYRGQIQLRQNDAAGAVDSLQQALKNDSNNAVAHYHLGHAFDMQHNEAQAESELREAVRLRPDFTDAQKALSALQMRRPAVAQSTSPSGTDVDFRALIQETQQLTREPGYMGILMWMPVEYMEKAAERAGFSGEKVHERYAPLRKYTMIVAGVGKLGIGNINWISEPEVRSNLKLRDAAGNDYEPVQELSGDAKAFATILKPMMANMLGKMGENVQIYFFPGADKMGNPIADPLAPGSFSVVITNILGTKESIYEWKLPLTSLSPPRYCPVGKERMQASWKYCPWHGVKLDEPASVPVSAVAEPATAAKTETSPPTSASSSSANDSSKQPESPAQALYAAARRAENNRDYSTCAQLLEDAVAKDPNHKLAWSFLGWTYNMLGKYDKAEFALRKAIALNPSDDVAYNNLGQALAGQKKYEEAIPQYQKQIEMKPRDQWAHANLGRVYILLQQYEKAIPELEIAASITPDDPAVPFNLGRAYAKAGQPEKAAKSLMRSVELQPVAFRWNVVAYEMALDNLDLDQAQKYAESAIAATVLKMQSTSLDHVTNEDVRNTASLAAYWDTFGWIRFQQGKLSEAEKYVKSAWLLYSTGEVCDHLAQIYEKQGRKAEAIHQYELALATANPMPETRGRLASLLGSDNDIDQLTEQAKPHLKEARTIQIKNLHQAEGIAEFWILLSPGPKVRAVKFITGEDELARLSKDIEAVSFPDCFPEATEIQLIRRGRLSCPPASSNCSLLLNSAEAVQLAELSGFGAP
jgi:dipeptidyl aminopeptidase/acylaminoacyl peptidase/tetratricopeptide (TPR) repeat protein